MCLSQTRKEEGCAVSQTPKGAKIFATIHAWVTSLMRGRHDQVNLPEQPPKRPAELQMVDITSEYLEKDWRCYSKLRAIFGDPWKSKTVEET